MFKLSSGPKMKDESVSAAVEVAGASVASKVTTAGAGVTGLGWWFSSEAAVFVGILIGVAGYLTNVYFQLRRDRREQRESEARMKVHGAKDG